LISRLQAAATGRLSNDNLNFTDKQLKLLKLDKPFNLPPNQGSRKNKFKISGAEAPDWQGANTQEYLDIPSFRNAARQDASAYKM